MDVLLLFDVDALYRHGKLQTWTLKRAVRGQLAIRAGGGEAHCIRCSCAATMSRMRPVSGLFFKSCMVL
jgi:hypothetical protein